MADMTDERWDGFDRTMAHIKARIDGDGAVKAYEFAFVEIFDYAQALRKENQRLRAIQKEVVCAGCGKVTASRDDADYREKMADHILACKDHPIQELLDENERLRKERYNRVCECGGVVFGSADHPCDKCGSLESVECLAVAYCKLRGEVEQLRAERLETTEHAFYSGAEQCKSGEREGWWDTLALSDIRDFGDELVDAGVFEKHPDGYGRRQFYRPVDQKSPK